MQLINRSSSYAMFTQFEMFGKFHKGYSGASSTVEDPVFMGKRQIVVKSK